MIKHKKGAILLGLVVLIFGFAILLAFSGNVFADVIEEDGEGTETEPPVLVSHGWEPEYPQPFDGIRYFGEFADESGVAQVRTTFRIYDVLRGDYVSPTPSFRDAELTSGDIYSGVWSVTPSVTSTVEGYLIFRLCANDTLGNYRCYPSSTGWLDTITYDGTAPETEISFFGPLYEDDGDTYLTSETQTTLRGIDPDLDGSGIYAPSRTRKIHYWIDDGEEHIIINNSTTFNITEEDGAHTIYYYSVDFAGNRETTQSFAVILDNSAPALDKEIGSPQYLDGQFVTTDTEITLTALDGGVGVSEICYEIDFEEGGYGACVPGEMITLSFSEESEHELTFWTEDFLGNRVEMTQTHYVDDSAPITMAEFGMPFVEDGWRLMEFGQLHDILGVNTPITISVEDCGDADECEAHPVGTDETFYKLYMRGDGSGGTELEWYSRVTGFLYETREECEADSGGVGGTCQPFNNWDGLTDWLAYSGEEFFFDEEGMYKICRYSVDFLGNREMTRCELVWVDNTMPEASSSIGEPRIDSESEEFIYYISGSTPIELSCSDVGERASGEGSVFYRTWLDGEDREEFLEYGEAITIPEESLHGLEYFCTDGVGLESERHEEFYNVDVTPPETLIDVLGEHFEETYITPETTFSLSCSDEKVGCLTTFYRIDNGEETVYSEEFSLGEFGDGEHIIYYYSNDRLMNMEMEHSLTVILDSSAPEIEIIAPEEGEGLTETSYYSIQVNVNDEFSGVDSESVMMSIKNSEGEVIRGPTIADSYAGERGNGIYRKAFNLAGLPEGNYSVVIDAADVFGHEMSVERAFALAISSGLRGQGIVVVQGQIDPETGGTAEFEFNVVLRGSNRMVFGLDEIAGLFPAGLNARITNGVETVRVGDLDFNGAQILTLEDQNPDTPTVEGTFNLILDFPTGIEPGVYPLVYRIGLDV